MMNARRLRRHAGVPVGRGLAEGLENVVGVLASVIACLKSQRLASERDSLAVISYQGSCSCRQ